MENTERRLTAMHPACNANYDGTTWNDLNGWYRLDAAGTRLCHETVIDLSGYAMDSLTFFPTSVGLQDPGIYIFQPTEGSAFNGMHVLDIITSVPMDLDTLGNLQAQGIGPGMLGSKYEFETLLLNWGLVCWNQNTTSQLFFLACIDSSPKTKTSLILITNNSNVHKDSIQENQPRLTNCIAIEL